MVFYCFFHACCCWACLCLSERCGNMVWFVKPIMGLWSGGIGNVVIVVAAVGVVDDASSERNETLEREMVGWTSSMAVVAEVDWCC